VIILGIVGIVFLVVCISAFLVQRRQRGQ